MNRRNRKRARDETRARARTYKENAKDDEIEAERIDRGDTKKRREKFLRPDRDTHGEKRSTSHVGNVAERKRDRRRRNINPSHAAREDVTGNARETCKRENVEKASSRVINCRVSVSLAHIHIHPFFPIKKDSNEVVFSLPVEDVQRRE